MIELLVLSDSHRDQETFTAITNKYKDFNYKIHCGDSDMPYNDPSMNDYIKVKGNHDEDDRYPLFSVLELVRPGIRHRILVIHGHLHSIWKGYDEVIKIAKENNCKVIFHGHTHIPHVEVIDGILCLNPGSVMFNRGSYGYGSYVIFTIDDTKEDPYSYKFYHHTDHDDVTEMVLDDGCRMLAELKPYII